VPGPITKSRLAINVARSVKRFIDVCSPLPPLFRLQQLTRGFNLQAKAKLPCENPEWQVGPGHITVEDLLLVSMHQNSKGSWQAHLRLARPRRRSISRSTAYPSPTSQQHPIASTSRGFPGAL
jgi:hypothetical protein